MEKESLFKRVGGEAGIEKLVGAFYGRVLDDAELAPFFDQAPMEKLRRMQVELFSAALGGPAVYSGRPIREVHAGRGIEKAHLRRFVEHLLPCLQDLDLEENEINAIYSRLALMADEVTGGGTEDG